MAQQQSSSASATFQFSHTLRGTKLFDWGSSANWVNGVTPGSLGGTAAVTIPASGAGTSYDNVASLTLASVNEQAGRRWPRSGPATRSSPARSARSA
jgi:hypothetical protein